VNLKSVLSVFKVLNQHTYYVNHGEGSEGGMGSSIGMPDSNDSPLPDEDDDDDDDKDDDEDDGEPKNLRVFCNTH
jgi:hypothetical protein